MDPSDAFSRLASIDFARTGLNAVLSTIAGLAREAVQGASEVSITLVRQDRGVTVAFTGDLAVSLDEQQYERGYGPCLDSCDSGEVLVVVDAATEDRWPAFTHKALSLGVHSSLSVPLPVRDAATGAMNFYALTPGAFDEAALRAATTFADFAAVAVANARSYETITTAVERMRGAARTRSVIDQAKGILIARHRLSAENALNALIRAARQSDRRLAEVAAALIGATYDNPPELGSADLAAAVEHVRRAAERGAQPDET